MGLTLARRNTNNPVSLNEQEAWESDTFRKSHRLPADMLRQRNGKCRAKITFFHQGGLCVDGGSKFSGASRSLWLSKYIQYRSTSRFFQKSQLILKERCKMKKIGVPSNMVLRVMTSKFIQ
ncbi:hypothetical protein K0M31_005405 [Melipona bicolor]|uniref:Uncharacterized protein n=1 Tax=Melipona bicolor TaxID=60889 RepID=A0AA40KMI2_9HYME|nr:hypothetical protein K0M31_005405 [Melipona bicolor]